MQHLYAAYERLGVPLTVLSCLGICVCWDWTVLGVGCRLGHTGLQVCLTGIELCRLLDALSLNDPTHSK
jgi:hypothetical protein